LSRRGRVAPRLVGVVAVALAAVGGVASSASAAGTVAIEPREVEFGVLLPRVKEDRSITVRNLGPDAVQLADIYLVGDVDPFDFVDGSCDVDVVLPPNGQCDLTMRFAPSAAGDFQAALVIEGGLDDEPAVASLTGRSRPPGKLVATPGAIRFGTVPLGTTSAAQHVQVYNDGGSSIPNVRVTAGRPFAVSNGCGTEIQPLTTCEIAVSFTPDLFTIWTSEGAAQSTDLVIESSLGFRQRLKVPMSATVVRQSGKPYPSRQELSQALKADMRRMSGAAIRKVRGGSARSFKLPRFRGGPHGTIELTMRARVGKRWAIIAATDSTLDWDESERLRLRLTKTGRRVLRGANRVRVKTVVRFQATEPAILGVLKVHGRATVRPVTDAEKKRR
jgi:hypothetical protein